MIKLLKKYKFKTGATLNEFVTKARTLEDVKAYKKFLDDEPKVNDFIDFDSEGFALNENKPIFKGWDVCEEASSEDKKVALKDDTRVYFDTNDGVVIFGKFQAADRVTYNDLFIFFEGKLEIN